MTILPIVERELRVAARKRITYWNRSVIILLAAGITMAMLSDLGILANPAKVGRGLFHILTNIAFFCCLVPAVFLTSDCLSEEKREGTLGLLFLTDLKGYDVVVGKLIGTSLNSFYGLLATFPILAVPFLLGGVDFGEFGRTMLALLNTLLFSLAAGMFVSSVSSQAQKAHISAAMIVFAAGYLLPLLGSGGLFSPRLAFGLAASASFKLQPQFFLVSLVAVQATSWTLLVLACRGARHAWHEEGKAQETRNQSRAETSPDLLASGRVQAGYSRRGKLLERSPMEWLARRARMSWWIWVSLVAVAGCWLAGVSHNRTLRLSNGVLPIFMSLSFHAALKFWAAWEAHRRFWEARRNGLLEAVLSTPLTQAELLRGQIKGLLSQFIGPIGVVLVLDLVLMMLASTSARFQLVAGELRWSFVFVMVLSVTDVYALIWYGLWLGLSARKSALAVCASLMTVVGLSTGVCVLVLQAVTVASKTNPGSIVESLVTCVCLVSLACCFFGFAAYQKLDTRFRQAAMQHAEWLPPQPPAPSPETAPLGEYFSLFKD